MLRRATGLFGRSILAAKSRSFSTDLPAAQAADASFVESWKKVVPNSEPPKTPLAFMQPRLPTPTSIPTKLTVNFVLPYASELSGKELLKNYATAPTQKEEMVKVTQGVSQQEKIPKVTPTKICIAIRSFDNPAPEELMGLPPHTRKVRLPGSRVLYTVLRSPHIDKKSREQFELRIKKKISGHKTNKA